MIDTRVAKKTRGVEVNQYPVTDEWRARVKEELARRGWDQSDLARELGTSTSLMSHLMLRAKRSDLVAKIHRIFDWPAPLDPLVSVVGQDGTEDALFAQLRAVYQGIDDQKLREEILAFARWKASQASGKK